MAKVVTDTEIKGDMLPSTPRLRRSLDRSNPLTLDNNWQSIPFRSINTPYDVNTFQTADFNEEINAIMPSSELEEDQIYRIEMDLKFSHTKRPVHFQMRFRVPSPTPITVPFPETDGFFDLLTVPTKYTGGLLGNLLNIANLSLEVDNSENISNITPPARTIYSAFGLKQYGVIPEIRISQAYTGADRPKLIDAILFMYPA